MHSHRYWLGKVGIAVEAVNQLNSLGLRIRLVSMPSTDVFDAQD
jgi:transketolase